MSALTLAPRTRVVGIGGGTGLSVLLDGLRRLGEAGRARGSAFEITAVVSVADDGGSTGRLREALGVPALGDLRQCMAALAPDGSAWSGLLQHRFDAGDGLAGHALGNLVLAATIEQAGGLLPALDLLRASLNLRGRVLPATEAAVTLCAELADGRRIAGESAIRGAAGRIARVWLTPASARPADGVLAAIAEADVLVLGPGSLFSSVLPNLLVDGVARAVRRAAGVRVFVCNLMTERGETDGFDLADHLRALERLLGAGTVDACVVNDGEIAPAVVARYAERGASPVRWSGGRAQPALPGRPLTVHADLLPVGPFRNRHDSEKLARAVMALAECLRRAPWTTLPTVQPGRARSLPTPGPERALILPLPTPQEIP